MPDCANSNQKNPDSVEPNYELNAPVSDAVSESTDFMLISAASLQNTTGGVATLVGVEIAGEVAKWVAATCPKHLHPEALAHVSHLVRALEASLGLATRRRLRSLGVSNFIAEVADDAVRSAFAAAFFEAAKETWLIRITPEGHA